MHHPANSNIEKLLLPLGLEKQGERVAVGTQLYEVGCLTVASLQPRDGADLWRSCGDRAEGIDTL